MTVDLPPSPKYCQMPQKQPLGRARYDCVHDPTATSEAFGSILVKAVDITVITLSPALQQNAHPC